MHKKPLKRYLLAYLHGTVPVLVPDGGQSKVCRQIRATFLADCQHALSLVGIYFDVLSKRVSCTLHLTRYSQRTYRYSNTIIEEKCRQTVRGDGRSRQEPKSFMDTKVLPENYPVKACKCNSVICLL